MRTDKEWGDHGFAEAWRAFKAEEATLSAPPSVFDAVMHACHRELERRNRPPEPSSRRRHLSRRHRYLMMAAAALFALGAAVAHRDREPHAASRPAGDVIDSALPHSAITSPTSGPVEPVGSQPPPQAARVRSPFQFEPLQLVRVRMPREALQIFGVSLIDPQAEGLVDVELIVADDGLARAIRSVTAVVDGMPQE